jgi:pyrophosphatase PpaX
VSIAIAARSEYIFFLGTIWMTRGMKSLDCVIFDIDGTLTQTHDLIFASFNHVTGKYLGREFSPEEIIPLFGPPEEGALARVLPEDLVAPAMDELCAFYADHHEALASLHEGMDTAVDVVRRHEAHTAVFTGKGRRTTEITLRKLGLFEKFDLIVSGNDVVKHKPDPEGILLVLETFGLNPSRALMVGDTVGDLRASRGAGVPMAAVLWDSYDRERLTAGGPDFVFATVCEFTTWLAENL